MRTKTKAFVLAFCAVLLVVATAFVTMAFLTSQASVKNTFTYGEVKITLDEADVKTDGTYETDETVRVTENKYKLIPGHTYIKDPTIHVAADSEDCWLFVKLENGLKDIIDAVAIEDQMTADGRWRLIDSDNNIYAYKDKVSAGTDVTTFANFKIKGDAEVSEYGAANITVTAYAIQADGFDTADAAWSAAKLG